MLRKLIESALIIGLLFFSCMLFESSQRLAEHHAHRERILRSLFSVVFICSETGVPFFVSENASEYFGWSSREILDNGLDVLMPSSENWDSHAGKFHKFIQESKEKSNYRSPPKQRTIDVRCKNGTLRRCVIRMFAVVDSGVVYVYATVLPLDALAGLQQPEAGNRKPVAVNPLGGGS